MNRVTRAGFFFFFFCEADTFGGMFGWYGGSSAAAVLVVLLEGLRGGRVPWRDRVAKGMAKGHIVANFSNFLDELRGPKVGNRRSPAAAVADVIHSVVARPLKGPPFGAWYHGMPPLSPPPPPCPS